MTSLVVLEKNEQLLSYELTQTINTLQATVKAYGAAETGLLDRISILQAEVEDERRHNGALEKALQAERAASAALERQVQLLQREITQYKRRENLFIEGLETLKAVPISEVKQDLSIYGPGCGLSPRSASLFRAKTAWLNGIVDKIETAKEILQKATL